MESTTKEPITEVEQVNDLNDFTELINYKVKHYNEMHKICKTMQEKSLMNGDTEKAEQQSHDVNLYCARWNQWNDIKKAFRNAMKKYTGDYQ